MSRYYPEYGPEVGTMLLNVEAEYPQIVDTYLDFFNLDKLPAPTPRENNNRAYQCWNLQAVDTDNDGTVDYHIYVDTFVPNNKAGYVQALTSRWAFGPTAPEGRFDQKGNLLPEKKTKANAN